MGKRKRKDKSNLTSAEIEKFKALLLTKRAEILGDVSSMEAETLRKERSDLSNVPFHMADAGSDNFEMENTLGLMDEEIKLLTKIDAALNRMENGTYGICEGNHKPIPKARLEAIPWAKYSVEYAQLLEKGLVGEQDSFSDLEDEYGTEYQDDNEPDEPEDEDEGVDELYDEDDEDKKS